MNRLVGRDKVDVVVGSVHSGVVMAMVKVARDTKAMLVIPNAGANDATGPLCAPNIFRTSFSNWQPNYPMGKVVYDAGHRNVATITWRYTAGQEQMAAFKEGFTKAGGKVVEELVLPFPEVRVPGSHHALGDPEARRRVRLLRRRRGREVRQGLRCGRLE